ncbi:MAG TPA: universal stress protein [Ginsengibacter sp.]|nr:universal stress protein [Ginsengibacter sp.]HRP18701.1 universal stress protein [Ginsengibacter sp.]HRP44559.1 universal stress protein [Ginsengibacter sp.]
MRRILVPTDFSQNASKALAYAAELASASGATIYLLHVIEPSLNMATMQTDSLSRKVIEKSSENLQLAVQAARKVYPKTTIIPHLEGGKIVDAILGYASKKRAGLIIMGTKGAGGLKKFFLGTVAANTVERARIPVLTIPVSYEVSKPGVVLFATNQFEKSKRLLNKLMAIPLLFKAKVHVVAYKEKGIPEAADYLYNEEQIKNYLRFLKENYPSVSFKGTLLEGASFGKNIEAYCDKNGCDIIAMVPYPKSLYEKILRRSETKRLIFHSTKPVMALPAIPLAFNP